MIRRALILVAFGCVGCMRPAPSPFFQNGGKGEIYPTPESFQRIWWDGKWTPAEGTPQGLSIELHRYGLGVTGKIVMPENNGYLSSSGLAVSFVQDDMIGFSPQYMPGGASFVLKRNGDDGAFLYRLAPAEGMPFGRTMIPINLEQSHIFIADMVREVK